MKCKILHLVNNEEISIVDASIKFNIKLSTLRSRVHNQHMTLQAAIDFKPMTLKQRGRLAAKATPWRFGFG